MLSKVELRCILIAVHVRLSIRPSVRSFCSRAADRGSSSSSCSGFRSLRVLEVDGWCINVGIINTYIRHFFRHHLAIFYYNFLHYLSAMWRLSQLRATFAPSLTRQRHVSGRHPIYVYQNICMYISHSIRSIA